MIACATLIRIYKRGLIKEGLLLKERTKRVPNNSAREKANAQARGRHTFMLMELKLSGPSFFFSSHEFIIILFFIFTNNFILLIFKISLLLFNYSCLHFLPTPPPYPSQTHLPPLLPPSPLVLSRCPHCLLPPALWLLLDCS